MSRTRCVGLAVALICCTLGRAQPAAAEVVFSPPTNAPILDPFRLPDGPYGAGNRGIEYDTAPGAVVVAAADGVVAFAGSVAGSRFVSVDHPGGLRSTYGFVGTALVRRGMHIRRATPVAIAEGPFHFTVRRRGVYVDPDRFFGTARTTVRLVPHRRGRVSRLAGRRSRSGRYTPHRLFRAPDDTTSASTDTLGSCHTRSPRRPARTRNRERRTPWQSSP